MNDIVYWYKQEVERWRTGASVAWSVLLLPVSFFVYIFVSRFSILHPYYWIWGSIVSVVSLSTWWYLFILSVLLAVTITYISSFCTVHPTILSSRISYLWHFLNPSHLLLVTSHMMVGGMIAWIGTAVVGGNLSGLSRVINKSDQELNEHHLFFIFHGIAVGKFYAAFFLLFNSGYMAFPVVQQEKVFQVKSSVFPVFVTSFTSTIRRLPLFLIWYYIIGGILRDWLCYSLKLQTSTSTTALNSIWCLFDMSFYSLLWHCIATGTLMNFIWMLGLVLYKVYNTEPYTFPIESSFEDDSNKCIHHAMTCKYPLVQYLGYLDLYLLSKYSPGRRRLIFSLSQPGGHPHNWRTISKECLFVIEALTNTVVAENNSAIANGFPVRQPSGDKGPGVREDRIQTISSQYDSYLGNHSSLSSSYIDSSLHGSLAYRGTIMNGHNSQAGLTSVPLTQPSPFTKMWESFKKRKLLGYFFNDIPESKSQHLFAKSQIHIWALEALSHLSAASYTEDRYGVVQKSLPDILTAMLSLQEAIEKYFKLSASASKRSKVSQTDVGLRFALKSTLKTSIYRMATTFENHLNIIPLAPEHCRKLKMYLEHKE